MSDLPSRQRISRRFFVGGSVASALPLVALARPSGRSDLRSELDGRVAGWLADFADCARVSRSRAMAPTYHVVLQRSRLNEFYESLAQNFINPWVGKHNWIELRSGNDLVRLRIA